MTGIPDEIFRERFPTLVRALMNRDTKGLMGCPSRLRIAIQNGSVPIQGLSSEYKRTPNKQSNKLSKTLSKKGGKSATPVEKEKEETTKKKVAEGGDADDDDDDPIEKMSSEQLSDFQKIIFNLQKASTVEKAQIEIKSKSFIEF